MSSPASTARTRPGDVTAPFAGVVSVLVREGQRMEVGDVLATIEAMKSTIQAQNRRPSRAGRPSCSRCHGRYAVP